MLKKITPSVRAPRETAESLLVSMSTYFTTEDMEMTYTCTLMRRVKCRRLNLSGFRRGVMHQRRPSFKSVVVHFLRNSGAEITQKNSDEAARDASPWIVDK
jgi:hypothetical protein